jgi:hypothetical protein
MPDDHEFIADQDTGLHYIDALIHCLQNDWSGKDIARIERRVEDGEIGWALWEAGPSGDDG